MHIITDPFQLIGLAITYAKYCKHNIKISCFLLYTDIQQLCILPKNITGCANLGGQDQTLPLSSRLYYYRARRFKFSRGKNVGSASLHSTVGQYLHMLKLQFSKQVFQLTTNKAIKPKILFMFQVECDTELGYINFSTFNFFSTKMKS